MGTAYAFFSAAMIIMMSLFMGWLTLTLISSIHKAIVRSKLKKYNLNEYEIIFKNSYPSILVSNIDKNNIIYL